MEKPIIKSVTVKKDPRTHLWHVHTNDTLLAVILNKKGALGTQELIQRMAGLPVTVDQPEQDTKATKPVAKKAPKPPAKAKQVAKKAPAKEAESTKPPTQTSSGS